MDLKKAIQDQLDIVEQVAHLRDAMAHSELSRMRAARTQMMFSLRQATAQDYLDWLKNRYQKFGDRGFMVTSVLPGFFVVASEIIDVFPLFGSLSINIIVPDSVTLMAKEGLGYNQLYLADGTVTPYSASVYISKSLLELL